MSRLILCTTLKLSHWCFVIKSPMSFPMLPLKEALKRRKGMKGLFFKSEWRNRRSAKPRPDNILEQGVSYHLILSHYVCLLVFILIHFRHSRFGGTFVLSNVKSISDNDMILYKPLSKVDALSFSEKKVPVHSITFKSWVISSQPHLTLYSFTAQNQETKE